MPTVTLHDTHKIAGHYLSYLINNDYSGLSGAEIDEVIAYAKTLPPRATLDVVDDEAEFARCRVSSQMGGCYTVDIYTETEE